MDSRKSEQKNNITYLLSRKLNSIHISIRPRTRVLFLMLLDVLFINAAAIGALLLRFEFTLPENWFASYRIHAWAISLIMITVFWFFSLYNSLWSFASVDELVRIVAANLTGAIGIFALYMITETPMPRSIFLLLFIISTGLTGGLRFSYRFFRQVRSINHQDPHLKKRTLIVGAGQAGALVVNEMLGNHIVDGKPVGFIDDDKYKLHKKIHGVKVLGNCHDIPDVVKKERIAEIIIAIPSLERAKLKKILSICKETGCKLKTLPGVYEIIDGKVSVSHIRDVAVEDLLGREPVRMNIDDMCEYITGKIILVTGGAGSIGSELCRQIAKYEPKQLIIIDVNENTSYLLQREFQLKYPGLNVSFHIASIRDRKRMEELFKMYRPQKIFHAAAHKHVPLMETDPIEAVKNNVFGTLNMVELSHKYHVKKFVMISTDKAVNPTSVMGATKRIAEKIIQAMNKESETDFVAVRFGNVLGSNGSVIPIFKKQIERGGPVTVTHPDIIRYFMTIPEAVSLVLQAGAMAKGGEIFVLDMGEPFKIIDLARDLIRLSGLEPDKDIQIEFSGLRPGEKLYEELLMDEEGIEKTENEKIFIGKANGITMEKLKSNLDALRIIAEDEKYSLVEAALQGLVETYNKVI
ncbi:MAG: polysaccharide biosynthesis protein [Peptostreptococcaceae bacterium]|nr:polysaccharide biosynthesis protein [Peptostreptococcaceae bacterium]